jgi:pyrophosphatase PpaX
VKAILWDLDDTVLDTLAARMRALQHAHEATVGGWVDPQALWRSHRGGTLESLAMRLLGDRYQEFTTAYREFYYGQPRRARPYSGILNVLERCRAEDIALGIVTSKVSWGATEELDAAGLLHLFGTVVGFDDTDAHKPEPDPIFEAMSRLCIDDAASVAYVGDSPADIGAAHAAGVTPIAAAWGSLDVELLIDARPTYVARSPTGVLEAVGMTAGAAR